MISVAKQPWKTERRVDISKARLFLLFLVLVCAGSVNGQNEEANGAFEFWSRMDIRWVTKKSIQHDFEFQYRNQQRVASLQERFQLYTFRWYILKQWDKFYMQSSPVTFFERQTAEGLLVNEFRMTQNVGWFLLEDKFQIRTGVEGRFFWTDENHFEELRLRTRLLYVMPIAAQWKLQMADEIFFHERTSGVEVPFFDQNRISIGLNYKISQHWSVDFGYQFHIRSFKEGDTDNFNVFYFYTMYQL
jgi:hypothetical protein